MNKIILTGRLTKDAELSFLPSVGIPKINFSLAVERNYQKDKNNKKVDFINCEMLEYCKKSNLKISALIELMWNEFKRFK